jgi:predicted nucleotidyltransferase
MKLELKVVDLLARNKGRKFTINEIARILKSHYSFLHRTINKLTDEDVIIKEAAGSAYLCSINLSNEKTFALIQLSEIEKKNEFYNSNKEIKVMLEDFVCSAKLLNPISIVLFGSYAKGTATKESDIDILLISKTKIDKKIDNIVNKIIKEMYAKYGKEINVILMSIKDFKKQKDKDVIKEIIKDHCILYGVEKFVNLVFK